MTMQWRNTEQRYGLVHVALHWLTATTVVGLFALGLWMVGLTYHHPWYNAAPTIHKSVGMLLIGVVVIRVVWRLSNTLPPPAAGVKPWEAGAAHIGHLLLYGLLFAVLISGYLIPTADGVPVAVFDWFTVPALPPLAAEQESIAGTWHEILAWGLIALAAGHAAAALKHHFLDRDATLRRMLGRPDPRTSSESTNRKEQA